MQSLFVMTDQQLHMSVGHDQVNKKVNLSSRKKEEKTKLSEEVNQEIKV